MQGVRKFLGFANFYRRFIQDFAKHTRPLHNLTKKDTLWRWGEAEQHMFDELKAKFCEYPVLVISDITKPFRLNTDASDFATGAVLYMKAEDDKWHPCAYMSKSLSDTECNYNIYDKELLTIIRALEQWRHYLEGAHYQIKI